MSSLLDYLKTHEEAFRSPSRLASLYSDFRRQKTSNPDGYAANSQAWLRALTAAARGRRLPGQTDAFVITTGEELARALQTSQYGRPLALQTVIEDAVQRGQFIPTADFLAASRSIYDKSWTVSPWQLVDWALTHIGSPLKSRGSATGARSSLVVVENLEAIANEIEAEIDQTATSNVARILSSELFLTQFRSVLGPLTSTSDGFKVLMTYLSRDRKCLAFDSAHNVIKFKPSSGGQVSAVTSQDLDIASLRQLLHNLSVQIASIEQEVAMLDSRVREAVKVKNMMAARRSLRMKKATENTLEQRQATFDQLHGVYSKIEQAADQVEIVKVMQAAGRTLKSLNKEAGDVDDIRDVMDSIQDSIADTDEIGDALNIENSATDEAEVEDELDALEREERDRIAAAEAVKTEQQHAVDAEETRKKLEGLEVPLAMHENTSEQPSSVLQDQS